MNKLKLFALAALALVGFAGAANAADTVLLATCLLYTSDAADE